MSVEYCVVRTSPEFFANLQQEPAILDQIMDGFYSSSSHARPDKGYIDSRQVFQGSEIVVPTDLRMIYFDEFTASLLVDFREESSAFFTALVGWGSAHALEGVRYGHGDVAFYSPEEAGRIAGQLNAHPNTLLEKRFQDQAHHFRTAVAGMLKDDEAILAHQRDFADFLRRFYEEATQTGDFVLLLMV